MTGEGGGQIKMHLQSMVHKICLNPTSGKCRVEWEPCAHDTGSNAGVCLQNDLVDHEGRCRFANVKKSSGIVSESMLHGKDSETEGEFDFVVVTLPLGVLKKCIEGGNSKYAVEDGVYDEKNVPVRFETLGGGSLLSQRKKTAICKIGMGCENVRTGMQT